MKVNLRVHAHSKEYGLRYTSIDASDIQRLKIVSIRGLPVVKLWLEPDGCSAYVDVDSMEDEAVKQFFKEAASLDKFLRLMNQTK